MPEFVVYEVVREIRFRKWKYELDAETLDDALAKAKVGNASKPKHCGELGEPEEVHSGWAVRPKTPNLFDNAAWNEAYEDCEQVDRHGDTHR